MVLVVIVLVSLRSAMLMWSIDSLMKPLQGVVKNLPGVGWFLEPPLHYPLVKLKRFKLHLILLLAVCIVIVS